MLCSGSGQVLRWRHTAARLSLRRGVVRGRPRRGQSEMKRSIRKTVDPYPCMTRGATEFEEKRIECDFTLVFGKVANLALSDLKSTYEYVYRQAYFAGKAAGKRESLGSPTTEI